MDKIKVLVIEDNPVIARMNEVLLKTNGYAVVMAGNGLDGIRLAKEEKPNVILLDIILPEMHGLEVCKELRNAVETRKIPVIIVTGSGLEEIAEKEPTIDAQGYLAKPYDFEKLEAVIKKVLKN